MSTSDIESIINLKIKETSDREMKLYVLKCRIDEINDALKTNDIDRIKIAQQNANGDICLDSLESKIILYSAILNKIP